MEGREPATATPAETKLDTFILLNSGHSIKIPIPMEGREPATARPAETKSVTFILLSSGHDIKIRCASIASPLVATWKIDGVSMLSNIQFSKEGIRPCMKSIWCGTYKTNICAEI